MAVYEAEGNTGQTMATPADLQEILRQAQDDMQGDNQTTDATPPRGRDVMSSSIRIKSHAYYFLRRPMPISSPQVRTGS